MNFTCKIGYDVFSKNYAYGINAPNEPNEPIDDHHPNSIEQRVYSGMGGKLTWSNAGQWMVRTYPCVFSGHHEWTYIPLNNQKASVRDSAVQFLGFRNAIPIFKDQNGEFSLPNEFNDGNWIEVNDFLKHVYVPPVDSPVNGAHPNNPLMKIIPLKMGRLLTDKDIGQNIIRRAPYLDTKSNQYDWSYIPPDDTQLKNIESTSKNLVALKSVMKVAYSFNEWKSLEISWNDGNWILLNEYIAYYKKNKKPHNAPVNGCHPNNIKLCAFQIKGQYLKEEDIGKRFVRTQPYLDVNLHEYIWLNVPKPTIKSILDSAVLVDQVVKLHNDGNWVKIDKLVEQLNLEYELASTNGHHPKKEYVKTFPQIGTSLKDEHIGEKVIRVAPYKNLSKLMWIWALIPKSMNLHTLHKTAKIYKGKKDGCILLGANLKLPLEADDNCWILLKDFVEFFKLKRSTSSEWFKNIPYVLQEKIKQESQTELKDQDFNSEDPHVVLGLNPGEKNKNLITLSYRRLALKYHPDKNKEGAEIFEKIKCAYDDLIKDSVITFKFLPECSFDENFTQAKEYFSYLENLELDGQNRLEEWKNFHAEFSSLLKTIPQSDNLLNFTVKRLNCLIEFFISNQKMLKNLEEISYKKEMNLNDYIEEFNKIFELNRKINNDECLYFEIFKHHYSSNLLVLDKFMALMRCLLEVSEVENESDLSKTIRKKTLEIYEQRIKILSYMRIWALKNQRKYFTERSSNMTSPKVENKNRNSQRTDGFEKRSESDFYSTSENNSNDFASDNVEGNSKALDLLKKKKNKTTKKLIVALRKNIAQNLDEMDLAPPLAFAII